MTIIFLRTLLLYTVVIGAVRLMGKRQLGELQPAELVTTILISNIATLSLEDAETPLLQGILPITVLVCCEVLVSWVTLRSAKLRSVSAQDLFDSVRADMDHYLRLNELTGGRWLCVSRVPDRFRTRDGLRRYVDELRALTDAAAARGQRVCFHPVAGDHAPVDGVCPVEYLLEMIPALQLCLDLYHLDRAGLSMTEWIGAHAGRIEMVHFKDARAGVLTPAGSGEINWDGVVGACLKAGVRWAFVEQETWDGDPYKCLGEALGWLRGEIAACGRA